MTTTSARPSTSGGTGRTASVVPEGSSTRSFRGDIQGLRALAVIAVILDHLLAWPSGGFLGVDVFFVISGFIITSLLLRQHDKLGRISFAEFYRKRVKRILPASTAVLLVTVGASWMVFLSGRASAIAWDSVAAFFFVANWRFAATDTDYWAADSAVSPVQHYWSLGVEEQFYVVWPILLTIGLALSLRFRGAGRYHGILTAILLVVTVGSFAWAMADTAGNAAVAYFSTFSRAWELGIGALLAVATPLLRRLPDAARPVLAWSGLAVIAYGLFALSSASPIPAPGSVIPVVGAALVIAGGTGGAQRFLWPLTNPVSRYLGDISYSLYLWHFPVIVILAAVSDTAGIGYPVIVLVLTLGLSVLSYHGLEDPIRRSQWLEPGAAARRAKRRSRRRPGFGPSTGTKVAALGTAALLTVTFISLAVVRQQEVSQASSLAKGPAASTGEEAPVDAGVVAAGDLGALQGQIRDALAATSWPALDPAIDGLEKSAVPVEDSQGCAHTDADNPRSCSFGDVRKPTIMVLGDSTGITLLPTVRALFEATHHIRGLTFAGCAVMDVDWQFPDTSTKGGCLEFRDQAVQAIQEEQPEILFVSNSYGQILKLASKATGDDAVAEWSAGVQSTVGKVRDSVGQVVLVSSPPVGQPLETCATKVSTPADCQASIPGAWKVGDRAQEDAATALGIPYLDTSSLFCWEERCPSFVGSTPTKRDSVHTTPQYAAVITPAFKQMLDEALAAPAA
ncbi:acyltransferase family protein [Clavibacter sp. MX14-G9D]|uniref:acyltransferase family protein n=1 Tax=Clavibacter sp. MX14-G9D TaxID=3064656 RepID=UPI00293E74C0|nr:acyltransferase family protein [Clavibacter sp. MX14-G9D]